MKKVKLYQNDLEPYLWTKDEIEDISKICPHFTKLKTHEPHEINFEWKKCDFTIARNYQNNFNNKNFNFIKNRVAIISYK